MWKNVSQYFSCFTFHEAAIQNSHWFCSEKSFEIRSTPGIMLGLFTFRYFVCSYNDSVRGISWKPGASPGLYWTLLQWLGTMGETDALQAASCLNDSLKQTLEKEGSFKSLCFLYSTLINLIQTVWSSQDRVKVLKESKCWSGMWWAVGSNAYLLWTQKFIQDYFPFQTSLEQ